MNINMYVNYIHVIIIILTYLVSCKPILVENRAL